MEGSPAPPLDYERHRGFDTGLFTARYLQALAWVLLAGMIGGSVYHQTLRINLSPVLLFWAAAGVRRHSTVARGWVLLIAWTAIAIAALLVLDAAMNGTKSFHLSLGGVRRQEPPLWQVVVVAVSIIAVAAVPACVLMGERARRQFGLRSKRVVVVD